MALYSRELHEDIVNVSQLIVGAAGTIIFLWDLTSTSARCCDLIIAYKYLSIALIFVVIGRTSLQLCISQSP